MRIAVTCEINDDFRAIGEITLPALQQYCLRHGYSLFINHTQQRSPQIIWQRVKDVRVVLASHSTVVHMDCDVLITNPEISIEALLEGKDADLFMSTDWNGINDGFCVWTDSWNSITALKKLLESANCYTSPQHALSDPHFMPELKMHKFPQRLTNSYITTEYGMMRDGHWQKGDFALHCPGLNIERRIQILQEHLP